MKVENRAHRDDGIILVSYEPKRGPLGTFYFTVMRSFMCLRVCGWFTGGMFGIKLAPQMHMHRFCFILWLSFEQTWHDFRILEPWVCLALS